MTASSRIRVGVLSGIFSASAGVTHEFVRLVVEFDTLFAVATTGVIQKDKMRVTVEFLRVNAILHEHELDVRHLESGFLPDFAAERVHGSFAPFDFAAGNPPEFRPFLRANHQHFARVVENERADGRLGG